MKTTISFEFDGEQELDLTRIERVIQALRTATVVRNRSKEPVDDATVQTAATSAVATEPAAQHRLERSEVMSAKRVLRRCSERVREFVVTAAHSFPPGEEFTLEDLAVKIHTDPDVQALAQQILRHPKAQADLVGALVSWRRNLSRPEKRIGQVLLERVDDGESPARYRIAASVPQALRELSRRPPSP